MPKIRLIRSIVVEVKDEIHDEVVFDLPPADDPGWVNHFQPVREGYGDEDNEVSEMANDVA